MSDDDIIRTTEKRENVPEWTALFECVEFKDFFRTTYIANAILTPTYEEVYKKFGVIRAEYQLLVCLAHLPEVTAQDVAAMSYKPRNSISRAVHRLQEQGYLNRVPDPNDGRQAKISITESGRALHDKIAKIAMEVESELFDVLTDKERLQFQTLLQKLSMHASTIKR